MSAGDYGDAAVVLFLGCVAIGVGLSLLCRGGYELVSHLSLHWVSR